LQAVLSEGAVRPLDDSGQTSFGRLPEQVFSFSIFSKTSHFLLGKRQTVLG